MKLFGCSENNVKLKKGIEDVHVGQFNDSLRMIKCHSINSIPAGKDRLTPKSARWVLGRMLGGCSASARQKLLCGTLGERSVGRSASARWKPLGGRSVGARRALGRMACRACSVAIGGISGVVHFPAKEMVYIFFQYWLHVNWFFKI